MRRRLAALCASAAVLALSACASDRDGDPRPTVRPENLFVSPSGEPFHGPRDGAYAVETWFAQADTDHDGRLTRAEFRADAERAFRRYDADGNGVIDGLELSAYEETIAPEILPRLSTLSAGEGQDESLFGGRGRRGGRRGGGGDESARPRRPSSGGASAQGAGLYGLLAEPEPVSAADADLDGRVTRAEWLARTDRRFDLLANGAEALTLATLPKTRMQVAWERRNLDPGKRRPGGDRRDEAPPPR